MKSQQLNHGEVDVHLFRNDNKLRFLAIVIQNLHSLVNIETTFIWDNIKQDFVYNQISLLGNHCTIPSMEREPCPTGEQWASQHCNTTASTTYNTANIYQVKKILLPGDHMTVKTNIWDQQILVESTKSSSRPPQTLALITNKSMKIHNTSNQSILMDRKIHYG